MTETIDKTQLEQVHKELDGQCQKCSQRCDRSVVRVANNRMLCPDCLQGKDRPVFTVEDRVIKTCSKRTGWEKGMTGQFLQHIPLGLVLVEQNDVKRKYWNPDRKSAIFNINSTNDGLITDIVYRPKKKK